jgi:hypothetical protein
LSPTRIAPSVPAVYLALARQVHSNNIRFQPTPTRAANGRYSLSVALVIESPSANFGG